VDRGPHRAPVAGVYAFAPVRGQARRRTQGRVVWTR